MGPSENVYVVDDDRSVREALCLLLRLYGWTVETYESATEFLARANAGQAGVVITDLDMPGTTGPELCRRLVAAGSPLAIIIISGAIDLRTVGGLPENGGATLLEKPFPADRLLAAVQQGWNQSRARVAQHAASAAAVQPPPASPQRSELA